LFPTLCPRRGKKEKKKRYRPAAYLSSNFCIGASVKERKGGGKEEGGGRKGKKPSVTKKLLPVSPSPCYSPPFTLKYHGEAPTE